MLNLNAKLSQSLRWSFSLGRKFISAAPVHTCSVQAIFVTSQIALLLAFFLPLKAIIIVSSGSIPSYFPPALSLFSHNAVVISLSLCAVIFFTLHLVLEFIASRITSHGARTLIAKTRKMVIFEDQDKIATSAYTRFTKGLADFIFFLVATLLLLTIYPFIVWLVLGCIASTYLLLCLCANRSKRVSQALLVHHYSILNSIAGALFLIVFFGVIGDFLYLSPPSAFLSLISLLVVRQALQRLTGFITKLISLRSQHQQVSALFFHNMPFISKINQAQSLTKSFLSHEQRENWFKDVISSVAESDIAIINVENFQIGYPDIHCYQITGSSNQGQSKFIIKIYNPNRSYSSEQELTLIREITGLPAPRLLKSGQLGLFTFHVFEWLDEVKLTGREYYNGSLDLHAALLKLAPPPLFLATFKRSKGFLETRIDSDYLDDLYLYTATQVDKDNVHAFERLLPSIKLHISNLPRQILAFDVTPDTLLKGSDGALSVIHWGNWHLEPVGANWPINEHARLRRFIESCKEQRPDFKNINPCSAVLASYMYLIERYLNKRDFEAALRLIPSIIVCVTCIEQGNIRILSSTM